jgi:hypothetical protein
MWPGIASLLDAATSETVWSIGQLLFEQHGAVRAELRIRPASARVDGDESTVERVEEHAFLAAVAPVRDAAATRRHAAAAGNRARLGREHPQRHAIPRVDRGGLVHARARVEHAVDHQWRRFEIDVWLTFARQGLPPPCDLETGHIARIDLIERGVTRRARIAAPITPFAVAHALLCIRERAAGEGACEQYGCLESHGNRG